MVREAVDAFLDEIASRNYRAHTIRTYGVLLRRLGADAADAQGAELLDRWGELAPATRAIYLSSVKAFRVWALELRPELAVRMISPSLKVKLDAPAPHPLEPATEKALEKAALAGGWRTALLYALMRELGLRIGEALGLRWDDLCLEAGAETITIRGAKGRKDVGLPLERDGDCGLFRRLVRRARKFKPEHFVLFTADDPLRGWGYRAALSTWHDLCAKAKVDVVPHQLRHTAGTAWLREGVDGDIVRRMLRHTSMAMVDRYGELSAEDLRKRLRKARASN